MSPMPPLWKPLPAMLHGVVMYPFHPDDLLDENANVDLNPHLVTVEVGDEVYCFESCTIENSKDPSAQPNQWYRGYVSCRQPPLPVVSSTSETDPSFTPPQAGPEVFVGIFPTSHIHIREVLESGEQQASQLADPPRRPQSFSNRPNGQMAPLLEEDEEPLDENDPNNDPSSSHSHHTRNDSTLSIPVADFPQPPQRSPVVSTTTTTTTAPVPYRPPPPVPSLKCLEETSAGVQEPLIDEISSALREWGNLLYTYLYRRDYNLFHITKAYIEHLHAVRRQLLANALSMDELTRLRQECVQNLVRCNYIQGLDLIVRHPMTGALVDVYNNDSFDLHKKSWVSAVSMFKMQVANAFPPSLSLDFLGPISSSSSSSSSSLSSLSNNNNNNNNNNSNSNYTNINNNNNNSSPTSFNASSSNASTTTAIATTTSNNNNSNTNNHNSTSSSLYRGAGRPSFLSNTSSFSSSSSSSTNNNNSSSSSSPSTSASFHHVHVELRAFVAGICAPGETAELSFSIYNKAETRFLTEDFSVVLNHQGSPVFENRLGQVRTLFKDFSVNDIGDQIFLVCKIVKNGSIRTSPSSGPSSSTPLDGSLVPPPPPQQLSHHSSSSQLQQGPGEDNHHILSSSNTLSSPSNNDYDPKTPNSANALNTSVNSINSSLNGSNNNNNNNIINTPSSVTPSAQSRYPMLHYNPATNKESFRRPFGCAVLDISLTAESVAGGNKDRTMPIFVPVNESNFAVLHEDIIASRIREFDKSPRAQYIAVGVKHFYGEAQTIVKENPSLCQNIPLTSRLSFPDVVFPSDSRNEVFLKLWSGSFDHPSPTSRIPMGGAGAKNIEVIVEVRRRDGSIVENSISRGAGEPKVSYYNSMVFKSNNNPVWGEILKIEIDPPELMEVCHVFFSFRSRTHKERSGSNANPDKPFAFAYLPLFPDNNGAFLHDGNHTLVLYRYDRQVLASQTYTQLEPVVTSPGAQPSIPPALSKIATPLRDSSVVRSSLVSTKYTQNETLLKLLRWESSLLDADPNELETVLTKLRFCTEHEIVKFLRPIFDALFGILVSSRNHQGEYDYLVFYALVTVLGIVSDRRFNNFKPVLDVYFEHHFTCSPAWTHLLSSLHKMLADPTGSDAQTLRSAIKVWKWLFHIVARSREIQRSKDVGMGVTSDHLEGQFKQEVSAILSQINQLMLTTRPPSIIGTQTLIVQNFADILPDLTKCFTDQELADLTISFCDSITAVKGKIVIWKLQLLLQLVHSVIFDIPSTRAAFVPHLVRWIKPHIGKFDEFTHYTPKAPQSTRDAARVSWLEGTRLSFTVIAAIFDRLHYFLLDPSIQSDRNLLGQEHDNVEYTLSLLPRLLESYRELQNQVNFDSVNRHRSPTSAVDPQPVAFPTNYPFSLLAPSLFKTDESMSMLSSNNNNGSSSNNNNSNNNNNNNTGNRPRNFSTTTQGSQNSSSSQTLTLELCLAEVASIIIIMLLLAPPKILTNYFDGALEVEGTENFSKFLSQLCRVHTSILNNEAFPKTWLNINILALKVFLKVAFPMANILQRDFIPDQSESTSFNFSLWKDFLQMLLRLLASEHLLVEEFTPQRRRVIWRLAGDIRGEGAGILANLWDSIGWPEEESGISGAVTRLGRYQVKFIPTLVEPLLELCLSHHAPLRSTAVHVLYSMIVSEYSLDANFVSIQNEVIDRLDKLFSQRKGDEISRTFFTKELRDLFDCSSVDDSLMAQVDEFLNSVNEFLDLLLSIRNLPQGEEYQDDRVIGTLRLMTFIRGFGQSPIFLRYVHRLVDFHISSNHFTEAALALKLHADLHDWNTDEFIDAMPEFDLPRQSSFARKEHLYLRIIDLLTMGKSYEIALEVSKELQQKYEYCVFDYKRNAELLSHQATLYDGIVSENRVYYPYFRIGFYGRGFPAALQNKQFITCGFEWERIQSFCQRMQNKHPAATLLKTNTPPDDDLRYEDGQFLQINSVTPEPDRNLDVFKRSNVPAAVRHYYENNSTSIFSFTRVVKDNQNKQQNGSGPANSVANLWMEKTIVKCAEAFPTIIRRSEIVEIETIEISPVENALMDVEKKTKELEELQRRYLILANTDRSTINTNPLSMALNGVVDAPINGGIPMYRKAFFGNNYSVLNPDKSKIIRKLRDAIDKQACIIGQCIQLHGALCPSDMQPFQEILEEFFQRNFAEELNRIPKSNFSVEVPNIQRENSSNNSNFNNNNNNNNNIGNSNNGNNTGGGGKRASLDLSRQSFSGSTRPRGLSLNGNSRPSLSATMASTQTQLQQSQQSTQAFSVHTSSKQQQFHSSGNNNNYNNKFDQASLRPTTANTVTPSINGSIEGPTSLTPSKASLKLSNDRRSVLGRGFGSLRRWKKNGSDE